MEGTSDRRNTEMERLKKRLSIVEEKTSDIDKMVSGMNYALFGVPQDKTNNGLVGTVHEVKAKLESANRYLIATLISSLAALVIGYTH